MREIYHLLLSAELKLLMKEYGHDSIGVEWVIFIHGNIAAFIDENEIIDITLADKFHVVFI